MTWIDEQRSRVDVDGEREQSEGSIRHSLHTLSRFFAWTIERGHATVNPGRQIPIGRRPQQAQKRDVPWLNGAPVRKLMNALRAIAAHTTAYRAGPRSVRAERCLERAKGRGSG
jgi:site-specific recombinase XerD